MNCPLYNDVSLREELIRIVLIVCQILYIYKQSFLFNFFAYERLDFFLLKKYILHVLVISGIRS